MPLTFNAIFLDNSGIELDPTEGNNVAENANLFVGQTFGGPGAALAGQWVSFTSVNNGGVANALDMNNNIVTDQAIIDNGSGPVTYDFDGTAVWSGTLTYIDGTSSAPGLQLVLVQMTNGDLYLVPRPTAADPTNVALSANQIQSVTITGLTGNTFSGMGSDRPLISFITCFSRGTRIAVPGGDRNIEDLVVGDLVMTEDHGAQPIRWIGRRTLTHEDLTRSPNLRPIRIKAGALCDGLPERDLIVSPQHRMLVRSRIAGRMFGTSEVLVAAKHLLGLPGIDVVQDARQVEYLHLIFDRHEVVHAERALAESLYLGTQALASLSEDVLREIRELFPELRMPITSRPTPARPFLQGRQGRSLCQRHLRNGLPLVA